MGSYYVYILFSPSIDSFYVGVTANLDQRIIKHNNNHRGFTAKTNDWAIVYSELFDNKSHALIREKQIKAWKSKAAIQRLIDLNTCWALGY